MSENQHAFRRGYSTETALTSTINNLEKVVYRKGVALCTFLDIQGAFDNIKPESIKKAMKKHDFPKDIMDWYNEYISGRVSTVDINGINKQRHLCRGTPQGGILSPIIWNIVFDELLDLFEKGPIKITGFANDACLMGIGLNHGNNETLVENMQNAINKAVLWGDENGLKFSDKKTVPMIFTRRTKLNWFKKLEIEGKSLEYKKETMYLGLLVDSKLHWEAHLNYQLKQARKLMMMI
jgi:hypothetical protein